MFSVRLECDESERDALTAEFLERGTTGVVEDSLPGGRCELRAFFDAAFDTSGWERWRPEWREEEDIDWSTAWRASWRPIEVGARFYLVPAWDSRPAPAGRLRLEMPAGMAFGTGQHATTQLCLEALEREVGGSRAVLDLGTGSGILAHAALLLGARPVVGCDIDPEAIRAARINFPDLGLFMGSLASIRAGGVDLLIANINAETILSLAGEIRRTSRTAILSGFSPEQAPRIESALGPAVNSAEKDGWSSLVWSRGR